MKKKPSKTSRTPRIRNKELIEYTNAPDALEPFQDEARIKIAWDEEFTGKCVACMHASPSKYKHQMTCRNAKALTHGLGAQGWGGGEAKGQVHKLFGCVYWKPF